MTPAPCPYCSSTTTVTTPVPMGTARQSYEKRASCGGLARWEAKRKSERKLKMLSRLPNARPPLVTETPDVLVTSNPDYLKFRLLILGSCVDYAIPAAPYSFDPAEVYRCVLDRAFEGTVWKSDFALETCTAIVQRTVSRSLGILKEEWARGEPRPLESKFKLIERMMVCEVRDALDEAKDEPAPSVVIDLAYSEVRDHIRKSPRFKSSEELVTAFKVAKETASRLSRFYQCT